jgi:hypothetical protein
MVGFLLLFVQLAGVFSARSAITFTVLLVLGRFLFE